MRKKILTSSAILACLAAFILFPTVKGYAAKQTALKSISLNRQSIIMSKGSHYTLKVSYTPKKASAKEIVFTSSNPKVARVDKAGKITAVKAGKTKITAKIKGSKIKASCSVSVIAKAPKITLQEDSINLQKGDTYQIQASCSSNVQLQYTSEDKTIAKVSSKGKITALSSGIISIRVKVKDGIWEATDLTLKVLRDEYDTPLGYDYYDSTIEHGAMTECSYYSSVTGNTRKCMVYTPPAYSTSKKYNVLYCMHGIGGDHKEWYNNGSPQNILDNLYAKGSLADMIVVFPNGRAMYNDSVPADQFSSEAIAAFSNFENDLKECLMPYINTTYSVYEGKEHTAMAGLSMGGMQTVNIGLKNLELFDYYGIFSPAPTTDANLMGTNTELYPKLIWLSIGTSDTTSGQMAENTHNILLQKGVEHIYYQMPGAHDWSVWKNGLYNFAQLVFK